MNMKLRDCWEKLQEHQPHRTEVICCVLGQDFCELWRFKKVDNNAEQITRTGLASLQWVQGNVGYEVSEL
jgi:hypothetical protein